MKPKRKKKLKIAILGTQASGKGTQSHILSITRGVPKVSVGNLLREVAKDDSERGRMVEGFLDKGDFPPEDVVMPVVKQWIDQHPEGWVIDGFPRTMTQAVQSASFFKPDAAIFLEVPDEEARRRISYRRICSKCKTGYNIITQPPNNSRGVCDVCGGELVKRTDDTPELVDERLRRYHDQTAPVKEWFRQRGVLLEIDGRPGLKEVAHDIELRLAARTSGRRRFGRRSAWLIVGVLFTLVVLAGLIAIGATRP